jgi:predicted transcriptional regulator
MNKLSPGIQPADDADDLGPLDEHGQQIWSLEEAAAIARLEADPAEAVALEEGLADIAAGRTYSHEEVFERLAEHKRLWRAERGL